MLKAMASRLPEERVKAPHAGRQQSHGSSLTRASLHCRH